MKISLNKLSQALVTRQQQELSDDLTNAFRLLKLDTIDILKKSDGKSWQDFENEIMNLL